MLRGHLDRVVEAIGSSQPGRCVLVRGRRRVGKSRLVEEFCTSAGVPSVFFTASRQGGAEIGLLVDEIAQSNLPGRQLVLDANPTSWDAALRLLAAAVDDTGPAIVVIDEFPYLVGDDGTIEAVFQKQWDRLLSRRPVLLVLVGSDMAMMEALDTHGRAFFQRGSEMVVHPLSPFETGEIVGAREPADAFDAFLLTGGLPLVCDEWRRGQRLWTYLESAVSDPTSALVVSAERTLAAEFPAEAQARAVLGQIGSGHVTHGNIARAAGGLHASSLGRSLELLIAKRIVVRNIPLSTAPSKEARYRVADPYLSFWLRFIGPHLAEIERGRGDRVLARARRDWAAWRGRAIEPIVREALSRLSPAPGLPAAEAVGGYWTRTNVPEVDLVGADRSPIARTIAYVGSIKWHDRGDAGAADVAALAADARAIPGVTDHTPLVLVSRTQADVAGATDARCRRPPRRLDAAIDRGLSRRRGSSRTCSCR